MEAQTLRSRLVQLAQKSRKALRLYHTMGRIGNDPVELTDQQLGQWKDVNAQLLRDLSSVLESSNSRDLSVQLYALRDRFHQMWRTQETRMHGLQKTLIGAAENGDFVKAAMLSRELVVIKAKAQASQAAHHELQDVIDKSKVAQPEPPIVLREEEVVVEAPESPLFTTAKIIPLRKNFGR